MTPTPAGTLLDLDRYDWVIEKSSVGHVQNRHGAGRESRTDQRAVVAADYAKLPSIINAADIELSDKLTDQGLVAILMRKQIDDEQWQATFEVRGGRKRMLVLKTLHIKK